MLSSPTTSERRRLFLFRDVSSSSFIQSSLTSSASSSFPPGASAAAAMRNTPAPSAEAWPEAEAARERTSEKEEDELDEAKTAGDSAAELVATLGASPPLAFFRASMSPGEATAKAVSRRAAAAAGIGSW